jgi:hypothetical protein
VSSSVKSEVAWPGKIPPLYMCLKTVEYRRNKRLAEGLELQKNYITILATVLLMVT